MAYHYNNIIDNFTGNIDNRLRTKEEEYTNDYSTPFPSEVKNVLEALIDETMNDFEEHYFMTTETQRKLLFQLVKLFRCSRILEIGTFTGVAAITMASAITSVSAEKDDQQGQDSKLTTLEINPKAIAIAQKYANKLKCLENRIEFVLGPAMER